jgi:hypothetical protein
MSASTCRQDAAVKDASQKHTYATYASLPAVDIKNSLRVRFRFIRCLLRPTVSLFCSTK